MERYKNQIKLTEIGKSGQVKLQKAKVLVIGAGGLGCAILPYLVVAGVGNIAIIDHDVVELSNLQRQILYDENAIGKSKITEAVRNLSKINSGIKIEEIQSFFNATNAIDLVKNHDIIVDATDNIKTRFLINDVCCMLEKPFVYGSVYKFEGQVAVFNYKGSATYRCVFGNENLNSPNCIETGVLGVTVGIIGLFQANEVLKIILNIGTVLSDKLMIYNTLTNEMNKFNVEKKNHAKLTLIDFKERYKMENKQITSGEVLEKLKNKSAILLDIREEYEEPELIFDGLVKISLYDLVHNLNLLDQEKEIIIICQRGNRSAIAYEVLKENGFKKIINFELGAIKFMEEISSFS